MDVSRRDLLTHSALGALALGGGIAPPALGALRVAAAGRRDDEAPRFASAREEMRAVIRVQGDLTGRAAPWWYTGYIYGMRPGEAPRKLVRFEGCEINVFAPQPDGSFVQTGRTTTFFQDPDSGAFLEQWDNPYTGERVAVRANILGGRGGRSIWSDAGIEPRFGMGGEAAGQAAVEPQKLHVRWTVYGSWVWMRHDRVYPPGLPQPLAESSSSLVARRDLLERRSSSAPALFSSTYMAPWPAWMLMQGQPGHVIWHADGLKLRAIEELPAGYLERARRLHPEQLATRSV
jgi:hypothetical protein